MTANPAVFIPLSPLAIPLLLKPRVATANAIRAPSWECAHNGTATGDSGLSPRVLPPAAVPDVGSAPRRHGPFRCRWSWWGSRSLPWPRPCRYGRRLLALAQRQPCDQPRHQEKDEPQADDPAIIPGAPRPHPRLADGTDEASGTDGVYSADPLRPISTRPAGGWQVRASTWHCPRSRRRQCR
jgi:hypothetical protein